jgi:hypothetical protein
MLEGDSLEVITKTGNAITEEVTNADLFSLLKTYILNYLEYQHYLRTELGSL